jgi:PAS domain S-box-containing protein
MKKNIVPTRQERRMREDDFIVSKTDLKGRITYGNRIFIEYSGYEESELLGAQHNIVRHPDMPRAVFNLLWETLKEENEFFGYVKNMAKDGSYYWVFANVTPSYTPERKLAGYYSVRRAPNSAALDVVKPLYAQMLEAEQRAGAKQAVDAGTRVLNEAIGPRYSNYETFVLAI